MPTESAPRPGVEEESGDSLNLCQIPLWLQTAGLFYKWVLPKEAQFRLE
jgi:hypothetical protein